MQNMISELDNMLCDKKQMKKLLKSQKAELKQIRKQNKLEYKQNLMLNKPEEE